MRSSDLLLNKLCVKSHWVEGACDVIQNHSGAGVFY